MQKLKQITLKNLGIMGFSQIFLLLLSLGRYILLAHLLTPVDFGLFALANAWLLFSKRLDDFGLEDALIQKKSLSTQVLIGSFWLRLAATLSFFILIMAVAPLLEKFYQFDQFSSVFRVLALLLLMRLPAFLYKIHVTRGLDFRLIAKNQMVGGTFGIVGTILLAFAGYGVWSLVWGTLLGEAITSFLYLIHKGETHLKLTFPYKKIRDWWDQLKEIRRFARPLLGASIVGFFVAHLDNLVVGKILGPHQLGFYVVAFTWANVSALTLVGLIGRVFFPTIARIQDNIDQVRRGYLDGIKWIVLVIAPANLSLLVLAPSFIENVLGEKWLPATTAMQILCVYGLIRGIGGLGGSVRKALGHPEIFLKLGSLFLVLVLIGIFPLTLKFGITGTAISLLFPAIVINIIAHIYNQKLLKMKANALWNVLWKPFMLTAFLIGFLILLKPIIGFWPVVACGTIFYLLLVLIFYKRDLIQLWQNIKGIKESGKIENGIV